jgi:hypothetical protein
LFSSLNSVNLFGERLSDAARRFLDRLLGEVDDRIEPLPVPFTVRDVKAHLKVGASTCLSELEALPSVEELFAREPLARMAKFRSVEAKEGFARKGLRFVLGILQFRRQANQPLSPRISLLVLGIGCGC